MRYMEGDPNTCSREEAQRDGKRKPLQRGLTLPLGGLASSCLHLCPFLLCLGGRALTPSILAPCMYVQQAMKQASRQAKKRIEGKHAKRQARKRCQTRANKNVKNTKRQTNMLSNKRGCPRRKNVGIDQISIVPLDWTMDNTQTHA